MLKLAPKLRLLSAHEAINFTKFETVRFRKRKPIHLGTAKSKLFRVPKRPEQPEEERLELQRLNNHYRTTMKSLRYYFIINHSAEFSEVSEDPEESRKIFEENFKRCLAINDTWNQEQQKIREEAIAKQHDKDVEFALERIEKEKGKMEETKQQIEEIVKKEKEQSKTFITPENIDEAIEQALANPVDYNFALNLNGDKTIGRENILGREKDSVSVKQ